MKKFVAIGLIFLFIVGLSTVLFADEGTVSTTPYRLAIGNKVARGLKNALLGWTEIPKRMVDITNETNDPVWGVFAGTFQGTLKAIARTASGVSDVVTAPISPEKGPLISPDINVE